MFPELKTERFILKRVMQEDLLFLFKGLSDPVTMPYNGVYYSSLEETKKQIEWYDQNWNEGTGANWKITHKTSRENIGVISYYYYKPAHNKAELGFWLLPEFWNQGITSEVLTAVIDYCQDKKGIHRLEAFVEEENKASTRVLEKAGFVCEGLMRDCEFKFGRYISLLVYGLILNDEKKSRLTES